ncbi:DUF2461 domain-containing protein [Thermodesulfobacteriota bacterium]
MSNFNGFPKELCTFFNQLKKHNTKEWFDSHREDYERYVKVPSIEFVVSMGDKLKEIAPGVNALPKINQSLFRLNRDMRFSNDKRPYKTNLGILFWEGERKRMECSGFYFHCEDENLMLGVGIYIFTKGLLDRYREAVVDAKLGSKLKKIIERLSKQGYVVGGKHYKKVPRGYDPSHKNFELLLHNGLTAMIETRIPEEFYRTDLIDYAFSHFKNMAPLHGWFREAL